MRLQKDLELSTGHRLPLHDGGCRNLHGHNYQVRVTIDFSDDNSQAIKGVGFWIDFSDIKKVLNKYFDHKFIMSVEDPYAKEFQDKEGVRIVDYMPTAENMSDEMVELVATQTILSAGALGFTEVPDFEVIIELNETSKSKITRQQKFKINALSTK